MSPTILNDAADWIVWALSPEHFLIAFVAAVIGVGTLVGVGLVVDRLWRQANVRLDEVAEPATALRTGWWLCPTCNSYNRPGQQCYKGCASIESQGLAPRDDESQTGRPTT